MTRQPLAVLFRVAVVPLLVGACAATAPHAELAPDDTATQLLEETESFDFRGWDPPLGVMVDKRRQEGSGPHGAFVEVYLNPVLFAAATQESEFGLVEWPLGSWAVALGYDTEQDDAPALIGIARKDEEGWLWAQLTGDGEAIDAGRPGDCTGCHGGANDSIFSAQFPPPPPPP